MARKDRGRRQIFALEIVLAKGVQHAWGHQRVGVHYRESFYVHGTSEGGGPPIQEGKRFGVMGLAFSMVK